jgi:hypothetical protein
MKEQVIMIMLNRPSTQELFNHLDSSACSKNHPLTLPCQLCESQLSVSAIQLKIYLKDPSYASDVIRLFDLAKTLCKNDETRLQKLNMLRGKIN